MDPAPHPPHSNPHGGPGHETRDVRIGPLIVFLLGLLGFGLFLHLVLGGVIGRYIARDTRIETPSPTIFRMTSEDGTTGRPPNLQLDPAEDMRRMRAEENEALNTYGWIDKQAGTARIPIDRAIDLLARKGLPTRGGSSQPPRGSK